MINYTRTTKQLGMSRDKKQCVRRETFQKKHGDIRMSSKNRKLTRSLGPSDEQNETKNDANSK